MKNGLIFSFGALAVALSMILWDQDVAAYFGQGAETHLWLVARTVTDIALAEYWFAFGILFLVLGFVRISFRRFGIYLLSSLAGVGIVLEILKFIIGRERPTYAPNFDPMIFHPFSTDPHFQSLPSGHTQVLFTVATSLYLLWPRLGWIVYPVAAILAFTRVVTFQHFLSDTIAGAMLAYFVTIWIHSLVAKKVPRPDFFVSEPESH